MSNNNTSNNLAIKSLRIGCHQYDQLQKHINVTAQELQILTKDLEINDSLMDKLIHAKDEKGKFAAENLTQKEKDLLEQLEPGFSEVPLTEHQRDNVIDALKRAYSTKVEMQVKPLQNVVFRDQERQNLWIQLIAMVEKHYSDEIDRILGNIGK